MSLATITVFPFCSPPTDIPLSRCCKSREFIPHIDNCASSSELLRYASLNTMPCFNPPEMLPCPDPCIPQNLFPLRHVLSIFPEYNLPHLFLTALLPRHPQIVLNSRTKSRKPRAPQRRRLRSRLSSEHTARNAAGRNSILYIIFRPILYLPRLAP